MVSVRPYIRTKQNKPIKELNYILFKLVLWLVLGAWIIVRLKSGMLYLYIIYYILFILNNIPLLFQCPVYSATPTLKDARLQPATNWRASRLALQNTMTVRKEL